MPFLLITLWVQGVKKTLSRFHGKNFQGAIVLDTGEYRHLFMSFIKV